MTRRILLYLFIAFVIVLGIYFLRYPIQQRQSAALLQELGGDGDVQANVKHETPSAGPEIRRKLFKMLQPVSLTNCTLTRFGEDNDGGYLMCGNLLADVRVGYSYGIAGYDKWGCDISKRLRVKVHQYDCFDTTKPTCPAGDTEFHAECIADTEKNEGGRYFDTLEHQLVKNGDAASRIVLKMDVEGSEWHSLLNASTDVLERVDQMVVEFHKTSNAKYLHVVERLKRFFLIAHIHFNNFSCLDGVEPFPAWAYEVLFVNKRVGIVDLLGEIQGVHPLDAPNVRWWPDCQTERR